MGEVLMVFGVYGLGAAILLIGIGALPTTALRYLSPLLVPLALVCAMIGFAWLWLIGCLRGFFWEPFNKANMPTSELKGFDQAMSRGLDYVSNPMNVLRAS